MDKEITIVTIKNQFNKKDSERRIVPFDHENLLELKEKYLPVPIEDVDFVVSVNGQLVPKENLALSIPNKGDCVVFTAKPRYGEIVVAVAWVLTTIVGGAVSAYVVYAVAALVYVALYAGLMIGMNLLVNALFVTSPDVSGGVSDSDRSQLYSWNPATTNKQGIPIQKMYGESMVYGNCISVYIENIETDSFLNVLIGLNLGPIYEISDIKLNEQEFSVFTGVTFETRMGYIEQSPITNFNDTKLEYPLSRVVSYGNPIVYKTVLDDFDEVEVDVGFPKGLYHMRGTNVCNHSVDIRIEAIDCDDETKVFLLTFHTDQTYVGEGGHWSFGYWTGPLTDLTWVELYAETSTVVHVEGSVDYWFYKNFGAIVHDLNGAPISGGLVFITGVWRWIEEGAIYATEFSDYVHFNATTLDSVIRTFRTKLPKKGHYYIRVTKLSEEYTDVTWGDELVLTAVREISSDDFSYPRMTLVGIKALATDQLSGTLGFSCMLKGSLIRVYDGVSAWTVEYNNNPAWVCYDILTQPVFNDPSYVCITDGYSISRWYRCKLSNTADSGNIPPNNTYWTPSDGPSKVNPWLLGASQILHTYVINDSIVYRCKLAHTASSDDEPGVGVNWETYWVKCTWTAGLEYVDITDSGVNRYDGINPSKLDYVAFKTWADFCDELVDDGEGGTEKRFVFNGGFDSDFTLWEAAIKVCVMSRAMLYWNGSKISVILDKADTPNQLFSSGNVIADSFEETFLPYEDRAGEIEVSFMNQDNGYQRDTFTIYNTTIDKPTNKVAVQLLGTTKASQAWRIAQFLLLCNQYLKRTISFKVDIDAIACNIGDVINFQHDVPQWGIAGGRVVSATANSVTIDTEVTIEAGKTYAIMIRLSDDTLVTKTVSNTAGSYSTLNVSTPFTATPSQYDLYSFGESATVTKPFRVQSIEKDQDQIMTITCLEYDSNVYSVDTGTPTIPDVDYTSIAPIAAVTDLSVVQINYFDESGVVKRELSLTFKKPDNPFYKKAIIYYKKDSDPLVQVGETPYTQFRFECQPLKTYIIYVSSESFSGKLLPRSEWVSYTITTTDDSPTPTNEYKVTGLQVFGQGNNTEFSGRDCRFVWNAIINVLKEDVGAGEEEQGAGGYTPCLWLKDYEVKIYNSSGTLVRTEYVTDPDYTYSYERNCEDNGTPISTFEIQVKARDVFGIMSENAAVLSVSNDTPDAVTGLAAVTIVGGVSFSWNKSAELDLQCYYIRTKVGSGSFSSWMKIADNVYTRNLTDSEIVSYGSNALITIEVQVMDIYNQVSSTKTENEKASTISDNLFQLTGTKSGGTGNVSDLYDGTRTSGGVII